MKEKMSKGTWGLLAVTALVVFVACSNGISGNYGSDTTSKVDKSKKTVIDNKEYIDFSISKYNATKYKKEDVLIALAGSTYKKDNSSIKMNYNDGTIELITDNGTYNNKKGVQMYAKYVFEVIAANENCLYIRKDPKTEGILIADNITFKNEKIPDITVCIPLYGYSKNRIEVSSIMNGFIMMPSGTYWNKN